MASDLERVIDAVESLAGLLERPAAAEVRHRVETGDVTASALTRDLLRVVYRLLFVALVRRRGGLVGPAEATGSLAPGLLPRQLIDAETVDGVLVLLGPVAAGGSEVLGALHESLLEREPRWDGGHGLRLSRAVGRDRKAAGAWFTPAPLVDHLLDEALEPLLREADDPCAVTVLDPSCGSGIFLLGAARRLARANGVRRPDEQVLRCLRGIDIDPAALELTRVLLWLELVECGQPALMPELRLRSGDALLDAAPSEKVDLVIGNPPFLNQLERLTTSTRPDAARLGELSQGTLGAYTDISAAFLQRSESWVRSGGAIALVQPQSLLAARDAAGVRSYLARTCALTSLWASEVPVFDASVLTCAVVLRRHVPQAAVRLSHGPAFQPLAPRQVRDGELAGEWSFLLTTGLGIPEVAVGGSGTLSDLAVCTADFRDQYYGLAPYVHERADCTHAGCVPLITTGLIEPAESLWSRAPTRFLKRRWAAPVVDVDALEGSPSLARWAAARLVPKVVVGTQGRIIEAVVDEGGRWLPSVPTITVAAPADRLWHVLAVLLAPPVVAHAAATYAGTGLTMRSIKLSASQVGRLPLPGDQALWQRGARLAQLAQRDGPGRPRHLVEAATTMNAAYDAEPRVLTWWLERARLNPGGR